MNPEARLLGRKVTYPQHYSPEVLVAIPRQTNRTHLNIKEGKLPFVGEDIWHAYELSFLTEKGLPVVGVLKLSVPASSPSIVESKSLKLYLNSFNMMQRGSTKDEGVAQVTAVIKEDLSQLLSSKVKVSFLTKVSEQMPFNSRFEQLEKEADNLVFKTYFETETLLKHEQGGRMAVHSALLRSNCKVTNQPDWGDVFIIMEAEQLPGKMSLLKYIVSFRNEQHFHEEICETIYERLHRLFAPCQLLVACLYTRRGGIDICPVRASSKALIDIPLTNMRLMTQKTLRG